jgi:hypothetical protein
MRSGYDRGVETARMSSQPAIPKAFNPEQTACMTRALLRAADKLATAGLVVAGSDGPARAVLAQAIVAAVEQGERDEDRLVVRAIDHFAELQRQAAAPGVTLTPA